MASALFAPEEASPWPCSPVPTAHRHPLPCSHHGHSPCQTQRRPAGPPSPSSSQDLASGPELTAAEHTGHTGYTGHTGEGAVLAQRNVRQRQRPAGPARGRRQRRRPGTGAVEWGHSAVEQGGHPGTDSLEAALPNISSRRRPLPSACGSSLSRALGQTRGPDKPMARPAWLGGAGEQWQAKPGRAPRPGESVSEGKMSQKT